MEDDKAKPTQNTRSTSVTQNSRTTRKRTVSDENADIPDLRPAEHPKAVAEDVKEPSKPAKAISTHKPSPVKEKQVEEEEETSSQETTPINFPGPAFEQPKDRTEDDIDAADLEETDNEQEEAAEQSASDDELCGPKTPMKRTHKAQSQYYTSSRNDAKRVAADVPLHTPPRRYGAHGATRPTPQTQKPSDQPALSESVARPMTVARADSRPFVFRKLKEDVESTPKAVVSKPFEVEVNFDSEVDREVLDTQVDGAESRALSEEDSDAEMADLDDMQSQHLEEHEAVVVAAQVTDPVETIMMSEDGMDNEDHNDLADSPTVQPPVPSYDVEESMIDVDSSTIEPPVGEYEPEDSMLDSPAGTPPVASYELDLDGSIIILSRDDSDDEECSDDEDVDEDGVTQFGLKTPRPETIPWQNIREDTTIPVDFDMHFADVRSPARAEDNMAFAPTLDFDDMQLNQFEESSREDEEAEGAAPDPTMNINDFIDIAALAEPTLQFDAVAGATCDEEKPQEKSLAETNDDTENTVIITRPESPSLTPTGNAPEGEQAFDFSPSTGTSQSTLPMDVQPQLEPLKPGFETTDQSSDDVLEFVDDETLPHYALPTLSSRRKSLPALSNQTPVRRSSRPITSDGASIARVAHPFNSTFLPKPCRSSTVETSNLATPVRSTIARCVSSARRTPGAAVLDASSPLWSKTPGNLRIGIDTPRNGSAHIPGQARTAAASPRFHTPGRSPVRRPATVQKLGSQQQRPVSTPHKATETPLRANGAPSIDEYEQPRTVTVPLRCRTPNANEVQSPSATEKPASHTPNVNTSPAVEHVSSETPKERFPRRSARQTYNEHASTAAPPARYHTPIQGKPRRPATAQKLASQSSVSMATPLRRDSSKATPCGPVSQATPKAATPSAATLLQRFPRRPPQQTYDERANTVIAPSRYRSPAQASPRRPATSQKPVNLRKVALKPSAPNSSHTPIKSPLKAPAMTPSQVPMTPHPGAPLRGVLALVEVYTLDGASASAPFISLLQRLGAKTTKSWSERVTHVIFKDGSPTTLQRVRLNNKEVQTSGKGFSVHCVNSRWVSDCDASGSRVDEDDDAYAVDLTEVPRGGNRRRKSMEPSALVNIGGNLVRDRKSSGRQSMGRSLRVTSAEKKLEDEVPFTPGLKMADLQDENDFDEDVSELATPDYLAAPDKLVQMTAPMNRVRKLDLKKDEAKNRRITSFWEGGE